VLTTSLLSSAITSMNAHTHLRCVFGSTAPSLAPTVVHRPTLCLGYTFIKWRAQIRCFGPPRRVWWSRSQAFPIPFQQLYYTCTKKFTEVSCFHLIRSDDAIITILYVPGQCLEVRKRGKHLAQLIIRAGGVVVGFDRWCHLVWCVFVRRAL